MINKFVASIIKYKHNPILFVRNFLSAEPDEIQASILTSVANNPRTTVRSGHGVGKTTVMAWTMLWFLTCFPNAKIPCTAPTEHQLKDILWAEVAKWLNNSPLKNVLEWTKERVFFKGYDSTWFAVARTAAKPDALQGFHGENILFLIDEASGVRDELFQPVLGALTTEGARLLMAGNPTMISGFFAESHTTQADKYSAIKIDGRSSPRVTAESVQLIIDMFGEDSDAFRVRVAGEFPKAMPDSFISVEMIEACMQPSVNAETKLSIDIGVDVARYGDDSSVIYGVFDKTYGKMLKELHKNDVMQVTGEVVNQLRFFNAKYPSIIPAVNIDCDGLGVGVYDRLKELVYSGEVKCNVFECHFGGRGGKLKCGDPIAFANSTGLMWGNVRQALQDKRLVLEENTALRQQLSNRKYALNSVGEIVLERKEDMKKRGVKSPDIGDALALALYEKQRGKAIMR